MQRKHIILLAAAAVLVVLNLWRWIPAFSQRDNTTADVQSAPNITSRSLTIFGMAGASTPVPAEKRNLFFIEAPVSTKPHKVHPVVVARTHVKLPSRRDLEKRAAQAELGTYRLMGIVIKKHSRQAFILKDNRPYIGRIGQRIEPHIRIEKITAKEVVLRDSKNRVTRTMVLSGD